MLRSDTIPLSQLVFLPRNPKLHDRGAIIGSYAEFGFVRRIVINEATGHMVAGNGETESLWVLFRGNESPPENIEEIETQDGGREWLVPVDFCYCPAEKEDALATALNYISERGGWDEHLLANILQETYQRKPALLLATGFDPEDINEMIATAQPVGKNRSDGVDNPFDPEPGFEIIVKVKTEDDKEKAVRYMRAAGFVPQVKQR